MKNVLIFGAGDGALRVEYMLDYDINILAYIDNNEEKIGMYFRGKKIISSKEIGKYQYDNIIIASISVNEIYEQLTKNLNIEHEKVIRDYAYALKFGRKVSFKLLVDEINDKKLSGSVAELGVYKGEFATIINREFPEKKLYLFDTFEGFDERDLEKELFSNSKIGEFSDTNEISVLKKMKYRENCIVKKGYFPESLDGLDEKFCFVSIDTDLYLSIYNGLKYFWPRLQSNGYILIHDYNSSKFKGVKQALRDYEKKENIKLKIVPIDDLCGSIVIVK